MVVTADIYSNKEAKIKILLMKGVTTTEHYWVHRAGLASHIVNVFQRLSAEVLIKPATYDALTECNDLAKCYELSAEGNFAIRPIVVWKNPYLRFHVSKKMVWSDVVFDGGDMVPKKEAFSGSDAAVFLAEAITEKQRYCLDQSTADAVTIIPNPDLARSMHKGTFY